MAPKWQTGQTGTVYHCVVVAVQADLQQGIQVALEQLLQARSKCEPAGAKNCPPPPAKGLLLPAHVLPWRALAGKNPTGSSGPCQCPLAAAVARCVPTPSAAPRCAAPPP